MSDLHGDRMTDPDKVAQLAADIFELASDLSDKRRLLLAEIILANHLALAQWTRNCADADCCKCGEMAHKRASAELQESIGYAAMKMLALELQARGHSGTQ